MFIKSLIALFVTLFSLINVYVVKRIEEDVREIEYQEKQKGIILKDISFLYGFYAALMVALLLIVVIC